MPHLDFWVGGPPDGRADPQGLVVIGPTVVATVGHWDSAANPPTLHVERPSKQVPALVDTGATESCIDAALARELELPVVDRIELCGAAGKQMHDVHLAYVTIPVLQANTFGRFAAVDLEAGGQPQRVLLGRTLLRGMILIYHGPRGVVTLAC